MDCLVVPVSLLLRRRHPGSRLGYRPLTKQGLDEPGPFTVVVGKEKREFLVDPFVLEENPFRVLLDTVLVKKENHNNSSNNNNNNKKIWNNHSAGNIKGWSRQEKRVILVDVDAILFEHMLWLMYNDCSSLFQLNVREIMDFYAQDF